MSPHHNNHHHHQPDPYEEDPYSSADEATTTRLTTTRTRRTTQNITTVTRALSHPAPSWDPQNLAFTTALSTIREDSDVKRQLERIEDIKTLARDPVLADAMYTEVMAVVVLAARAVCKAGGRVGRDGGREGEEAEEEAEEGFCWRVGRHPRFGSRAEEGGVGARPSAVGGRLGGQRRSDGGRERGDNFSLKVRTNS
ncbi:hypothetical protein FKW77_002031 [Venturia effusa]|uniref:Uncharacterized protein n=1 Tax=Venturia effusa TaxID=50376 RepID=A0A517L8S0_9PEZI|nr:hypothetical protein FKW77_002031 [Venturia effusa]